GSDIVMVNLPVLRSMRPVAFSLSMGPAYVCHPTNVMTPSFSSTFSITNSTRSRVVPSPRHAKLPVKVFGSFASWVWGFWAGTASGRHSTTASVMQFALMTVLLDAVTDVPDTPLMIPAQAAAVKGPCSPEAPGSGRAALAGAGG